MGEITTLSSTGRTPQKTEADRARDAKRLLEAETNILAIERAEAEAHHIELLIRREDLSSREHTLRLATDLPAAEHLERIADDLETAASAPPNPAQTLALLSLAEETMRRADKAPATVKLVVATHDLTDLGFSPFVVATALRECRRNSPFAPAISEIIDAARLALHGGNEGDYEHPSIRRRAERLRMMAQRKRQAVESVARAAVTRTVTSGDER